MKVLIVDNERDHCDLFADCAKECGLKYEIARSPSEAIEIFEKRSNEFSIAICDWMFDASSAMQGPELVAHLKRDPRSKIYVIMATAKQGFDDLTRALENGADEFISKDEDLEVFLKSMTKKLEKAKKVVDERDKIKQTIRLPSAAMRNAEAIAKRVGRASNKHVLITGEPGVGKERFARLIHESSDRDPKLFNSVNCAGFTETLADSTLFGHVKGAFTNADKDHNGWFLESDKGTLFLDEIGDLALPLQAKLLRALEYGEVIKVGGSAIIAVDVRVVAATNRNLAQMVKNGEFRKDLFWRLNRFPIHLPPLAERPDDVLPLATYYLDQFAAGVNREMSLGEKAKAWLREQKWSGNAREIQNLMERCAVLGPDELDVDALLKQMQPGLTEDDAHGAFASMADVEQSFRLGVSIDLSEIVDRFEQQCLLAAIKAADGNQKRAAKLLGLDSVRSKVISQGKDKEFAAKWNQLIHGDN